MQMIVHVHLLRLLLLLLAPLLPQLLPALERVLHLLRVCPLTQVVRGKAGRQVVRKPPLLALHNWRQLLLHRLMLTRPLSGPPAQIRKRSAQDPARFHCANPFRKEEFPNRNKFIRTLNFIKEVYKCNF